METGERHRICDVTRPGPLELPPLWKSAARARARANVARRGSGRRRPRSVPLEANGRLFA